MLIYDYLKKDHQKVSALFKKIIAATTGKARELLFLEVKKELELHADPEHNTFYKALSKSTKGMEDAEHGDEEHDEIKDALAKLSRIPVASLSKWLVQFGELKYIVEHHVEDEETKMFKDAKAVISTAEANQLSVEMEELKTKMKASSKFIKQFAKLDKKAKKPVKSKKK